MQLRPNTLIPRPQQGGGGNEEGLIAAVNHIVPAGAVPDAHQHKDNDGGHSGGEHLFQVGIGNLLGEFHHGFVEHNGVIQVFLHEFAQGHVPSLPVFGDAPGHQRRPEVFRQTDVQHLGNAHDHIDAAGKVRVNLEAVEHHGPEQGETHGGLLPQNAQHQNADPVGDDHLLEVAPEGTLDPHNHPISIGLVNLLELGSGFLI